MTTENNIDFFYESGVRGVTSPLQLPILLEDEKRLMRITSILDQRNVPETTENEITNESEQMDGVEEVNNANQVVKKGEAIVRTPMIKLQNFFTLKSN
jgi:hypothetical protein